MISIVISLILCMLIGYLFYRRYNTKDKLSLYTAKDVYLALFSSDKELGGLGYSRQEIFLSSASDGQMVNTNTLVFSNTNTDRWETVTHIGIADKQNGGNMLWYKELDRYATLLGPGKITFSPNDITIGN